MLQWLHGMSNIRYRRSVVVMTCLSLCGFALVTCMNEAPKEKAGIAIDNNEKKTFEDFAGAQKCASCHKDIFESHIKTAHFLTSKPGEEKWIKGDFEKGKNDYWYSPLIRLSMQRRDSGLYQVAYFKGEEKKAMRFDITIGSGAKGQSFLTWRNNHLFQLPITYFSVADVWSNSPGYPAGKVMIDKPVTSRCLECHVSFAQAISGPPLEPMEFDKQKILYGVDCEKCHGPAAMHVVYHTDAPGDKIGKYIINAKSFSRQQKLDMCALCHSGNIQKIKPSFEFSAGEDLSGYFMMDTLSDVTVINQNADVHGNQYGLMRASKCFRMSLTMTCNTCHDPHKNERGNKEIFSKKCMSCHNINDANFRSASHSQVISISKNCIDCHMPAQASRSIAVNLQGEEVPRASFIRTHFISIYKEESKRFKSLKK